MQRNLRLTPGDLILFNDTRVIPARLSGFRRAERGTAKIEITLNRPLDGGMWSAFAKPARRLRAGDDLDFRELDAAVVRIGEGGEVYLRFPMPNAELFVTLNRVGQTPTPPYLGRPADDADKTDYQTLFARTAGAVAAPTAGLHFDNSALASLTVRGVAWTFVTLHVGAGTFLQRQQAQVNLFDQRSTLVQAKYDLQIEKALYERLVGTALDPEETEE